MIEKLTQFLEPWVRRQLWRMPPETAHNVARCLVMASPSINRCEELHLETKLAGQTIPHPIGLAAGFDKSATMLQGLTRLGFAFIEAGTVTPFPQPGNTKPRLFRLVEDRALINRFGFNNDGLDTFIARLARRPKGGMLGANIGINKTSRDPISDFRTGFERCRQLADYVTINVSSPNTPGLRDLQEPESLRKLLQNLLPGDRPVTPIFLKLAPDLENSRLLELLDLATKSHLTGLILCNTTIARPENLQSPYKTEAGGLSGKPLRRRASDVLELVAEHNRGQLDLISAGGLFDAQDLYDRLTLGATAVQIYTSFIYEGPFIIGKLCADLRRLMDKHGVATIAELRGRDPIAA